MLVVGVSQSGKSSRLAIPILLEHDGPAVVLSAMTDLVSVTAGARQRRGSVSVFDPTHQTGMPSASWTPLRRAYTARGAARQAYVMVNSQPTGAGGDAARWDLAAADLLGPLMHAAARGGYSMRDLLRWVRTENITPAVEVLKAVGQDDLVEALTAVDKDSERLRNSQFFTSRLVLSAYADVDVQDTAGHCSWTPEMLLAGQHTLYLVAGLTDQQRLAPVLLAILDEVREHAFEQASARMAEHGSYFPPGFERLLWLTDEAANVAPMPDLPQFVSTANGRGITTVSLYQDLSQLQRAYGPEGARSVMANHRVQVYLPGQTDPETMLHLERVIGTERRLRESVTRGRDVPTRTESAEQRSIVEPRELRELEPNTAVVVAGADITRVRLRPWYSTPELKALVVDYHEPWYPPPRPPVPMPRASRPLQAVDESAVDPVVAVAVDYLSKHESAELALASVCACGREQGEHAGDKHRGGCPDSGCRRFRAATSPPRNNTLPTPVGTGDLARDLLAAHQARARVADAQPAEVVSYAVIDAAVADGTAERCGRTGGAPVWWQDRWWQNAASGDGMTSDVHEAVAAKLTEMLRRWRECDQRDPDTGEPMEQTG